MNREEWINRLKEVQPMLFDGLRRMVAIPSIRGKEEPDAPFGRGPKQALEEVLKIAKLSKLSFEETEIEKFQVELNDILKYIDMLNEVDTSEVQPLVHINDVVNNFREKEEKPSLKIEKVLLNAPESAENAIVVPKVVGE